MGFNPVSVIKSALRLKKIKDINKNLKELNMDRQSEIPLVKDILILKVIALRPEFTSFDAIKIFNEYKISTAPVVSENNEIIGYLS